MDPTPTTFFDAAGARLQWLSQRQDVLAQNIANADTPGWRARDLPAFTLALASAGTSMSRTDPRHLSGRGSASPMVWYAGGRSAALERAPDGNTVALDQQLAAAAETDTQHALVTDLYHTYVGLFRTALGK